MTKFYRLRASMPVIILTPVNGPLFKLLFFENKKHLHATVTYWIWKPWPFLFTWHSRKLLLLSSTKGKNTALPAYWTAGMFAQTCYLVLLMLTFWVLLKATEGLVHITSLWVKHVWNGCEKAFYTGRWPFTWSFPHWLPTFTICYNSGPQIIHLPSKEKLPFGNRLSF